MAIRKPSYNIGSTPTFGSIVLSHELSKYGNKPVYNVGVDTHTFTYRQKHSSAKLGL